MASLRVFMATLRKKKMCIRDRDGTDAVFCVADRGDGISPEDLPYIFRTFYTSRHNRADAKRGIGLGPVSYTHLDVYKRQGQTMAVSLVTEQFVPMGPAASQVAIKQTGTNGGGYMGVNSAHPLENANPFTNILEMISLLLIPVALCFTFGKAVKNKKQGIAIFMSMFIVCLLYTSGSGRVVKIAQYPPGRGDVLGKHRHGRLFFQAKNVNRALLRRPPSLPVAAAGGLQNGIQPRQFPISLWEIQIDPRLHQ